MGKKIRFPLVMPGNANVQTLEKLQESFDLATVLVYYRAGKLLIWLKDRYYMEEAEQIGKLHAGDLSFPVELCRILGVDVPEEHEAIDRNYLKRRNEKLCLLREMTDDERVLYHVDAAAFDQEELLDILDMQKKEIFLCRGEGAFEIPLSVTGVTYIGLGNPIVTIRARDNVDFRKKDIRFENLRFGWDISGVTPDDQVRQGETLFQAGKFTEAEDILKPWAEKDHPYALMLLYRLYGGFRINAKKERLYLEQLSRLHSLSGRIDMAEALTYLPTLEKLARKGNAITMYEYAYMLWHDGNQQEAMEWLKKSAEHGCAEAQYSLGQRYSDGEGVGKDEQKAFSWIMKAAEQGFAEAQNDIGNEYWLGESVKEDFEEAYRWYKKAAEAGNMWGQYNLGDCYYDGEGVERDYQKAVEWYKKAAEQGHADAQCKLGTCYYSGQGVEQDQQEAVEWYTKAAEQGDAKAQNFLGNCYYNGIGVEQNHQMSVEWYTKAAEQGFTNAQNNLGNCYYNGIGVKQDDQKAFAWYRKAAELGHATGQRNVGYCYQYGKGVARDEKKAFVWYKKSADQGNDLGLYGLGECYYNGTGVRQDKDKAIECYKKAAKQGNTDAINKLNNI